MEAAARYQVNPTLLHAIARTESGVNPRAIGYNLNGSRDSTHRTSGSAPDSPPAMSNAIVIAVAARLCPSRTLRRNEFGRTALCEPDPGL
ncbi:MAG: transglycosylase SLT domain-containing protein [Burkholderiales bacterium]|nr:transglycosylase SLT domain-containing protein [Burkholderiales bacterium]